MAQARKSEEELADLIKLMREETLDDHEAQQALAIDEGVSFEPPEAYYPDDMGQTLARELQFFYYFVAACRMCNLDYITSVCRRMLSYTQYLYEVLSEKRFPLNDNPEGKSVARQSVKITRDVCHSLDMLLRVQNMLYSTVEKRRRAMNVEGDVSDDTETDPNYSQVSRHTLLQASLPTLWYSTPKMKLKPPFSLINFLTRV